MFNDYEQKLQMFTYYKQIYVWLLSIKNGHACLLIMSKSYACFL